MPLSKVKNSSLSITSIANDLAINGLTIGKGPNAVARNTAFGITALAAATGNFNTGIGNLALLTNSTGSSNTGVGDSALKLTTTGANNTAIGQGAIESNTTGSDNAAIGKDAFASNTTGSSCTALGKAALNGNTTGIENTAVGYHALVSNTTASYNTSVGRNSLLLCTTGTHNTVIGHNSGDTITTGTKNTILGRYNGNQGGLDIRTASNRIVLSDGDGNPYAYWGATGQATFKTVGVDNLLTLTSSAGAFSSRIQLDNSAAGGGVLAASLNQLTCICGATGGVSLNAGATSWVSASDERVKENLIEITDGLNKVATLRAVTGNYIWDEEKKSRAFLIAQDVVKVLPEAVVTKNPEELQLGYTDVIPLLVAAIKELKSQNDSLKARLDAANL
jgi:hypothetical protein